ncbi:MAG: redoxin domain-containing protein [Acidobacteriota bacterium]|nr:redoxin domain-containing protein [Acidobacteriota bacterium]
MRDRFYSSVFLGVCLMLAGGLSAAAGTGNSAVTVAVNTGRAVSESSLPTIDLSGYRDLVANNRGKALMVNFWATWCEPCRDEFPMIEGMAKKYGPQGLTVIGVSLDEDSDVSTARQFVATAHADFPNYRVKQGIDLNGFYQGVNPSWQGTMPQTIFYARDGHVARYLNGARPPAAFEDAIRLVLLNSAGETTSK